MSYGAELICRPTFADSYLADGASRYSEEGGELLGSKGGTSDEFGVCSRQLGSAGATDVLGSRDGLEVRGSYAGSYSAKMVEIESLWDRPIFLLVDGAVCKLDAALELDTAVALRILRFSLPDPARRLEAAILVRPKFRSKSLAPPEVPDMAANEQDVLTRDVADAPVRHRRYWGWLSAAALAYTRGVQHPFEVCPKAVVS